MTDFERINQPRVEKITAMLEVIEKSGRSNRAGEGDYTALLKPVAERLRDLAGATPEPINPPKSEPAQPAQRPDRSPSWVTIREAAQQASLEDLTYAMAVYLNRIDEHLKG